MAEVAFPRKTLGFLDHGRSGEGFRCDLQGRARVPLKCLEQKDLPPTVEESETRLLVGPIHSVTALVL